MFTTRKSYEDKGVQLLTMKFFGRLRAENVQQSSDVITHIHAFSHD